MQKIRWSRARLNFVKMLSQAGIQFAVHLVDGYSDLTPDQLFDYLDDPNLFAARTHGVTLERWLTWKAFIQDPHCYALTKKGQPCKGWVCPCDLTAFIPGLTEYCHLHQKV